jgi:hypothetical protein
MKEEAMSKIAERRSLGDALSISPEKLAFIHGDEKPSIKRGPETASNTVDLPLSKETPQGQSTKPRRRNTERDLDLPNANDVLNEVLVSLTTKLPHRLIQSLRRLCLEQRLRHAKPDSIQDIVAAALQDWLAKQ